MSQIDTVTTFEVHLPVPKLTKFDRERLAFFRLLPDLLLTHAGQYVAIHDEQVVDSGPIRADVVCRTLDRVRHQQRPDGKWVAETTSPGMLDQRVGAPSKWVTLDALVLLRRASRSHGQDWEPRAIQASKP